MSDGLPSRTMWRCVSRSRKTQNRYAVSLALNGHAEESIRQLRVMRVLYGEKAYADIRFKMGSALPGKISQLGDLKLP